MKCIYVDMWFGSFEFFWIYWDSFGCLYIWVDRSVVVVVDSWGYSVIIWIRVVNCDFGRIVIVVGWGLLGGLLG